MAVDDGVFADQVDASRIADLDARELGFLEIAVHVEAIGVDQGQERFSGVDVIARPHVEIGDKPVDRRAHLGAGQIQRGNIAAGESLLVSRLRFRSSGAALLLLLLRDRSALSRL